MASSRTTRAAAIGIDDQKEPERRMQCMTGFTPDQILIYLGVSGDVFPRNTIIIEVFINDCALALFQITENADGLYEKAYQDLVCVGQSCKNPRLRVRDLVIGVEGPTGPSARGLSMALHVPCFENEILRTESDTPGNILTIQRVASALRIVPNGSIPKEIATCVEYWKAKAMHDSRSKETDQVYGPYHLEDRELFIGNETFWLDEGTKDDAQAMKLHPRRYQNVQLTQAIQLGKVRQGAERIKQETKAGAKGESRGTTTSKRKTMADEAVDLTADPTDLIGSHKRSKGKGVDHSTDEAQFRNGEGSSQRGVSHPARDSFSVPTQSAILDATVNPQLSGTGIAGDHQSHGSRQRIQAQTNGQASSLTMSNEDLRAGWERTLQQHRAVVNILLDEQLEFVRRLRAPDA